MSRKKIRCGLVLFAFDLIMTGNAQAKPHVSHDTSAQLDLRGTENTPLAVKLIPAPKTEDEIQKEKTESDAKLKTDRENLEIAEKQLSLSHKQADDTGTLVYVGWCQFGVFLLQLFAFSYQVRWMKASVNEMKKGTEATIRAANAASKSADVADKSLMLLERPYIFVMDVIGFSITPISSLGFFSNAENIVPYIDYTLINHGKTPAFIEEIWAYISGPDEYSPSHPIFKDNVHSVLNKPILAPGDSEKGVKEKAPETLRFTASSNARELYCKTPIIPQGQWLYFWVIVKYRGTFSRDHESSFCWIYSNDCFIPFGGAEYNYVK